MENYMQSDQPLASDVWWLHGRPSHGAKGRPGTSSSHRLGRNQEWQPWAAKSHTGRAAGVASSCGKVRIRHDL